MDRNGTTSVIALVVSGPSGAGKTTVCRKLTETLPDLEFSVSCTTRPQRPGEEAGTDYHFISDSDFDGRVEAGDFIEHATVHGHRYGTLKSEILSRLDNGRNALLDIDVQGAGQIRELTESDPDWRRRVCFVFFAPPSMEELERRLRSRQTEDEETIRRRLDTAREEMEQQSLFDHVVVNNNVDKAVAELAGMLP